MPLLIIQKQNNLNITIKQYQTKNNRTYEIISQMLVRNLHKIVSLSRNIKKNYFDTSDETKIKRWPTFIELHANLQQKQKQYIQVLKRRTSNGQKLMITWLKDQPFSKNGFTSCERLFFLLDRLFALPKDEVNRICSSVLSQLKPLNQEIQLLESNSVAKLLNDQKQQMIERQILEKYQLEKQAIIDEAILPRRGLQQMYELRIMRHKNKTPDNWNFYQRIIIYIYKFLTSKGIGILRADIDAQFLSNLYQMLLKKVDNNQQMQRQLSNNQIKQFFYQHLQLKYYRLPRGGLDNLKLQDESNLIIRQIMLQQVSDQQASERQENVLMSLKKIGKLHLSNNLQSHSSQWYKPLLETIKAEQNKCQKFLKGHLISQAELKKDLSIYAQYFVKYNPEKITEICISQLLKQIISILYKDAQKHSQKHNPFYFEEDIRQQKPQFFQDIQYKVFCRNLSMQIAVQDIYDEQVGKFDIAMKFYDQQFQSMIERKRVILSQYEQLRKKLQDKVDINHDSNQFPNQTLQGINLEDSQRIRLEQLQKQYEQKKKQIYDLYNIAFIQPVNRKVYKQKLKKTIKMNYSKLKLHNEQALLQIGTLLIFLIKQTIKIRNQNGVRVPLLSIYHKYYKSQGQMLCDARLRINQCYFNEIIPLLQRQNDLFAHLDRSVPTIIPPLRWSENEVGGYYSYPTQVMRVGTCVFQEKLVRYGDLQRIFSILDILGKTPWKINKKILEVVESIWQQGGNVGQIPKRYSEPISTELSKLRQQKNFRQKKLIIDKIQRLRDQHSLRSDFNLKLNMARSFTRVNQFYYPHNVDFRGRVYPVPPHLNHIGNDFSRGLLLFSQGKKLGKRGLFWLKVHCANLMGKDKSTNSEKIQYIQANIELIKAIAKQPLINREWLKYQDCWQCLAAIFQLNDALNHGNSQQFVSHLHIHQDGSCNGLQHYAALGRDMEGAFQVNLGPTQRPGDVYTHVAKMVIKMVEQDQANPQSKDHQIAKKLKGQIKRKTVKQTVMTSVYGVTFIGAKEQVKRQLRDQNFLKDQNEIFLASKYIAIYTLKAISNLFSSAHLIKQWLINCAKIVTEAGNAVGWITPVGLPVIQPYVKQSAVNSALYDFKKKKPDQLPISKNKQRTAFPPNFVHSLDSTHMMYTAVKCNEKKITFAAVHDSYWTHASTTDQMNEILREQFIRLHSQPLLEDLKASLQRRFPDKVFPQIPKRGTFNLEQIKKSQYFFS